jgi:hypothetical protein
MAKRFVSLHLALKRLLTPLLPVHVPRAVVAAHPAAFTKTFSLIGSRFHALALNLHGRAVAIAVELALDVEARTLSLHLAFRLTFRLALGTLRLAFLAGRLAVVILVIGTGKRGRCCGARQKESEEDLTHDLHLSSYEMRGALSQMSRGLTVTEPFIQVCGTCAAGCGGAAAARAIALRMRG